MEMEETYADGKVVKRRIHYSEREYQEQKEQELLVSMWKFPLAKRNIKKAVKKAINKSANSSEYVIDRIGYHLVTNTKAINELDYINEAIDTIKKQNLPVSIAMKIFEYVVLIIYTSRNA